MKVLVLGATGFIGFPAAQALLRAGYIVYGLARTEEKARQLAAEEIIPILGDADSDAWISLIPTLDLIIDALGGPTAAVLSRSCLDRAAAAATALRSPGATVLPYIYTSGTWVHGDSRTVAVTDTTPLPSTASPDGSTRIVDLVAWRPALEQAVLTHNVLGGIVVRPGWVYGRSGSLLGIIFGSTASGKAKWPGTPGAVGSAVHADDLADLYVRVARKASLLRGQAMDAVNSTQISVDVLLAKAAQLAGVTGYEYTTPTNKFEEALAASAVTRPYLAYALLDWVPKKPGLVEGLDVYYAAWKASLKA